MRLAVCLVLNRNVPIVKDIDEESIDGPSEEQQMSRIIICATTRSKQKGETQEIGCSDILPLKEQQKMTQY